MQHLFVVCPLGSARPRVRRSLALQRKACCAPSWQDPSGAAAGFREHRRAALPPVELALAEGFGRDHIARSVPGSILNACEVYFLCSCVEITANLAESSGSYYLMFLLDQMLPVYGWELHWFFFRNSMNPSFLSISRWNEEK